MAIPKNARTCRIEGTGLLGAPVIQVWKTDDGWRYDGIVSAAPAQVRKNPRGPYWRGPVSAQFVSRLLSAAEKRGFRVRCST